MADRKYYMLYILERFSPEGDPDPYKEWWTPQFGDYVKKNVEAERRDYHEGYEGIPMKKMRIETLDNDTEEAIRKRTKELNNE